MIGSRCFYCFALSALGACQTSGPVSAPIEVFPIYASSDEAKAIATGRFGAFPLEIPTEAKLSLVDAKLCEGDVTKVRSTSGRQGWAPIDSLPAPLRASLTCVKPIPKT